MTHRIEFAINAYEKKAARLECTITRLETKKLQSKA